MLADLFTDKGVYLFGRVWDDMYLMFLAAALCAIVGIYYVLARRSGSKPEDDKNP